MWSIAKFDRMNILTHAQILSRYTISKLVLSNLIPYLVYSCARFERLLHKVFSFWAHAVWNHLDEANTKIVQIFTKNRYLCVGLKCEEKFIVQLCLEKRVFGGTALKRDFSSYRYYESVGRACSDREVFWQEDGVSNKKGNVRLRESKEMLDHNDASCSLICLKNLIETKMVK